MNRMYVLNAYASLPFASDCPKRHKQGYLYISSQTPTTESVYLFHTYCYFLYQETFFQCVQGSWGGGDEQEDVLRKWYKRRLVFVIYMVTWECVFSMSIRFKLLLCPRVMLSDENETFQGSNLQHFNITLRKLEYSSEKSRHMDVYDHETNIASVTCWPKLFWNRRAITKN